MFSKICFLICLSTAFFKVNVWAQKNKKPQPLNEGMVTYAFKNNGKEVKERLLKLVFKNNIACLFSGNNPKEQVGPFIDYQQQETLQMLNNKEGNRYTLITPFSNYEKANLTGETETILGYKCQKAKVFIRSNTIEIWFTNELSIKGTPSLGIAPGLGLILKMVRNGNFETYAINIEKKQGGHGPFAPAKLENGEWNHDTIGMGAMDIKGNLSGSCTTSGAGFKMRGRLGDSPIIGAGLFVDNEVGACTATGQGEDVIRVAGSHSVVELMRQGLSPELACKKVIERIIRIKGPKAKDIQVGFLAINKKGQVGAYSIHKGFEYAIRTNAGEQLVKAKFVMGGE